MTFRPTGYTAWAAGATNIAEPTDAKKFVGWSINEQPASSYFNWLSNKVDAWRSYFDWATSLRVVVEDDFVRAIASGGGSGTITPMWSAASGGWILTESTDAPGTMQAFTPGTLGTFDLYTRVGSLNDRDFRVETLVKMQTRIPDPTGYFFFGAIGHYGFAATGPSSSMAFIFTPSGKVATSIDLGVVDPVGTTYKKYTAERHGATLGVYVDDVMKAAVPGVMMGATAMTFGARLFTVNVNGAYNCTLDRIGLYRKV